MIGELLVLPALAICEAIETTTQVTGSISEIDENVKYGIFEGEKRTIMATNAMMNTVLGEDRNTNILSQGVASHKDLFDLFEGIYNRGQVNVRG